MNYRQNDNFQWYYIFTTIFDIKLLFKKTSLVYCILQLNRRFNGILGVRHVGELL